MAGFGLDRVTRFLTRRPQPTEVATKAAVGVTDITALEPMRGWFRILEAFTGAFQRNITVDAVTVLTNSTVFACITLIASDIAKLWINLVEDVGEDGDELYVKTTNPAYSPVLRKPNHYQTCVKFIQQWQMSRLAWGNTYVLKERDNRNVVVAMYVLDPARVRVMVAPDGSVFYGLCRNLLAGLTADDAVVPAREIIHDVMYPLYHPLLGVSPIMACGLAAMQALKMQQQSMNLFDNMAVPSGILSAAGKIDEETAQRYEQRWQENYGGPNRGRIAMLGGGLTYTPIIVNPADAQLIEQLKWTDLNICGAFHVPPFKLGLAAYPPYTDVQSQNIEYYADALQEPIENLEALLTDGLALPSNLGVEFDLDALLRMDSQSQMKMATDGVRGSIFSPNEARAIFSYAPTPGGDAVLSQQQMFSLEALAQRDANDPFAKPAPPAPPTPATPTQEPVPPTKTIPLDHLSAIAGVRYAQLWKDTAA